MPRFIDADLIPWLIEGVGDIPVITKDQIDKMPVLRTTKIEMIESYWKIGDSDYQWSDNHGELIRCRKCRLKNREGYCTKFSVIINGMVTAWYKPDDDDFCSKAQREEE